MAGVWSWFVGRGVLIDITYTAVTTFLLYSVLTTIHFLREQDQRRQVHAAFSQYLAPSLVARLAENPDSLKIGEEMKPMTVLFSDVRGFTAIAERLRDDPQGLTRLINRYFTAMTDRILEFGGTIDKYMGDAIMAFWNAPLDEPTTRARPARRRSKCSTACASSTGNSWPTPCCGVPGAARSRSESA